MLIKRLKVRNESINLGQDRIGIKNIRQSYDFMEACNTNKFRWLDRIIGGKRRSDNSG